MSGTATAVYLMNPAEDTVLFGDELCDGMWVLPDEEILRHGGTEDEQLRAQRFCKVIRCRRMVGGSGQPVIAFVGEWVDGYQRSMRYAESYAWIVKKSSMPDGAGKP